MKFQARPILTDKGAIYFPKGKSDEFKRQFPKLQYAIILKADYSICLRIDSVLEDQTTKTPYITFNKEKRGNIEPNDEVEIYPFTLPVAKSCLVLLPEKSRVPEGDWGSDIINPSVEGEAFDYGDTMDFMYGTEKPMLLQATLKLSSPQPPVIIGPKTYFSVEKCEMGNITREEAKSHELKSKRAQQYTKLLEEQVFKLVEEIRRNATDKIMETSEFSQTNPQSIFQSIKKILFNYKIIADDFLREGDNTNGTIIAIPLANDPIILIEIRVFSNIKQGNLTVAVYSPKMGEAKKILDTDIKPYLKNVIQGLKETTKILYNLCAGCNGELVLSSQDERGIVKCKLCGALNQLPIDLRHNIELATLDIVEDEIHTTINDLVIKEVEMFLLNLRPDVQISLEQISKKLGISQSNTKEIIRRILQDNSSLGEYMADVDLFNKKKTNLSVNPDEFTNLLKSMEERKKKRS